MQIQAGWAKSLKLKVPEGLATRPTAAKIRDAVFNSLQHEIDDAYVLDLFAGSGAVGIEAASRGASSVVFVESQRQAVRCLSENLNKLTARASKQGVNIATQLVARSVEHFMEDRRYRQNWQADLIFADPPYKDANHYREYLLKGLAALVCEGALLVFEGISKDADEAKLHALLEKFDQGKSCLWRLRKLKTYGETQIEMYCFESR